jgi:hypothetical protein
MWHRRSASSARALAAAAASAPLLTLAFAIVLGRLRGHAHAEGLQVGRVAPTEQQRHELELVLTTRALAHHSQSHAAQPATLALALAISARLEPQYHASHVGDRDAILDVVRIDHLIRGQGW